MVKHAIRLVRAKSAAASVSAALTLLLASVVPSAHAQQPQVFYNPTLQGMRIDRCLTWATNCDEPAASVFCRYRGYSHAIHWAWEYTSPTIVQGDGQVCNANVCGAFTEITCQ